MTEEKIFEFFLQKQYDYPKLNSEAAATIANCFTDIIYDTLKLKSNAPVSKRLNILKLLKTLTANDNTHVSVNERNYLIFIKAIEAGVVKCDEFDGFLKGVATELKESAPEDFCTEVLGFYRKKNEHHQKKVKRLEAIKKRDQEILEESKFRERITRSISYYETNENIIKKLLVSDNKNNSCDNTMNSEYRDKQILLAYSLLHLKQWCTLKKILTRLLEYQELKENEINFLVYLSQNLSDEQLLEFFVKNFFFIFEKLLIKVCTDVIQVEEDKIDDFFENFKSDKNYLMIKNLCQSDSFHLKVKSILYELYTYSYCNCSLLKLIKFLL